jgi:hypothetical protein
VLLGPRTLETLIEEVGRLPDVVWELELSTAHRVVHRVSPCSNRTTKGWTARR